MVSGEISIVSIVVVLMTIAIGFIAVAILVYNYMKHSKLNFSFRQLFLLVTASAVICILGGLVIKLAQSGELTPELNYESTATFRNN